jgi:hypothetical protein
MTSGQLSQEMWNHFVQAHIDNLDGLEVFRNYLKEEE